MKNNKAQIALEHFYNVNMIPSSGKLSRESIIMIMENYAKKCVAEARRNESELYKLKQALAEVKNILIGFGPDRDRVFDREAVATVHVHCETMYFIRDLLEDKIKEIEE